MKTHPADHPFRPIVRPALCGLAATLLCFGCQSENPPGTPQTMMTGQPQVGAGAGAAAPVPTAMPATPTPSATPNPAGTAFAAPMAAATPPPAIQPTAGAPVAPTVQNPTTAPAPAADPIGGPQVHNCETGEEPDARDAMITSEPVEWVAANGDIDLTLPDAVLDWMHERVWVKSHDAWHNIRRCARGGGGGGAFGGFGGFGGGFGGFGSSAICDETDLLPTQNECENARDGYEFLVMHRHMIIALKQAFPQNKALFEAFPSFPYNAEDVPQQWQARFGTGWSASILDTARVLEDVENNLDQFPTEGDLGKYIQCGGMASGVSSIHGALHFKWVVNSSPHSLGNQAVNLENYMFWKLHGWIDNIWERYRVAKGLNKDPNDKLQAELTEQCWEMHDLGHRLDPSFGDDADARLNGGGPPANETGVFAETVRPILESTCVGCHSGTSPAANMPLGGSIPSADLVKGLVNGPTMYGGQFVLVAPGQPEKSWLYLKASDMARTAGCQGACNAQVMPPTGKVTLNQQQLDAIYKWIADGAE